MRVTRKADAAVRALMGLENLRVTGRKPASLTALGKQTGIPIPFLQQILFSLRKARLVRGVRGRHGGYEIRKPADRITIGTVLRAIQGEVAPTDCSKPGGKPICGRGFCAIREVWKAVAKSTERVVDRVSVGELMRRELRRS